MRGYRFAPQAWTSPHAVGTGPIVGLAIIAAMLLVIAALSGQ
jgi:hypothetical protein